MFDQNDRVIQGKDVPELERLLAESGVGTAKRSHWY